jgi:D-beta-D-heptose 7-phosphate kinase/D-beta-D-heptose 1-phosphate adenosyltransferase
MSAALVSRLASARVLVVGDVMLDVFVRGDVTRISPEAPVPVLRARAQVRTPGGAGHVARNLQGLGAAAGFVGLVGEDAAGAEIADLFRSAAAGLDVDLIVDPSRPTTRKERFVSSLLSTHLLRVDWEEPSPAAPAIEDRLVEAGLARLDEAGALVLSDYAKGVVTPGLAGRLIAAARARGAPVVVDPKGADWTRYRGADVLTPNKAELATAAGRSGFGDEHALVSAARALMSAHGLGAILVTRGEEGASLVTAREAVRLSAPARFVKDVSGAGDTVTATMAAALAAGLSLDEAAALAMAAAGVVVEKPGAAAISAGELAAALTRNNLGAGKVAPSAAVAAAQAADWKAQGLTVGFTNGCFDVLHAGHVQMLAAARAACDRLIVGLNDDTSVRRLKGAERPINTLANRAAVLAGLESVDLVAPFAEDTPLALIEAITPGVLIKGADYRPEDVVGRAHVEAHGGRLVLAELAQGLSTTGIVRAIRGG